mgnify:CR=1 FL=1
MCTEQFDYSQKSSRSVFPGSEHNSGQVNLVTYFYFLSRKTPLPFIPESKFTQDRQGERWDTSTFLLNLRKRFGCPAFLYRLSLFPMSQRCTHVKGNGGLKYAVREVHEQLPDNHFVMRTDVKAFYASIDWSRGSPIS